MISLVRGLAGCMLCLAGCAHGGARPPVAARGPIQAPAHAAQHVPFVPPSSYESFIRAELWSARGQHAEAIAAYRAALELGEPDPYVLARLARALDLAGRADEARALLTDALEDHPRSEALLLTRARLARRAGDAPRALEAYARAQDAARSPETALERIAYLRELGHEERALEALRALAAAHRGSVRERLRIELELSLLEGSPERLAVAARDWLALGGGDPGLTRRAALALFDAGRAALALELLSAVPPSEADAALRLRAALALGRGAECEHLLATLPPHWLGGPLAMAEAYLAVGLPEQALRVLEESAPEDSAAAARRSALIARSLVAAGRAADAGGLLGPDPSATTCDALRASGLPALAHEAGCPSPADR